jgi:hypothetical protein
MIFKTNITNKLKPFINTLIKECVDQRYKYDINLGNNYELITKQKNKLYKYFINFCKKKLKKFTVINKELKCWCYLSDKTISYAAWHDHIKTSTIVGVIYLKVPKENKGIDFLFNNKTINKKIKKGDLLIFPNFLKHYPYPSFNDDLRISINLELNCLEQSKDIFNVQ